MSVHYIDSSQKYPPIIAPPISQFPNHSNSGIVIKDAKSVGSAKIGKGAESGFFVLEGYSAPGVRARGTLVFSTEKDGDYYVVELVGANISTSDTSITDAIDVIVEEAVDLVFMASQGETTAAIQDEVSVIKSLFDFDGRA